jgi:acetyl esterase/lipase
VRAVARWISVLLTIVSVGVAALVVLPPPTKIASWLAVFFDENTLVLACVVVMGALFARLSRAPRWIAAQAVLGFAIMGVALVPPLEALRVAEKNHVAIDFSRYLRAPIDAGRLKGVETVVYATVDGTPLSMDVYRPAALGGPEARYPAILVLHEGGWSKGDKGTAPHMSAWLAAHGWAVFDAQYRLAPQPNWKTAIGDAKCAIGWVKHHARELGIEVDPDRVTLLGRSAGGHLSMLAAYAPDDPALPPTCEAGDTHVASVISYYGPTDLAWGWEHPTNPRVFDMRQRVSSYVGGSPAEHPDRYRLLSPLTHVTPLAPPTLLIHGGGDSYVPFAHTEFMARKLEAASVPHEVLAIPYAEHEFDFMFGGLGEQLAEHAILRFLHGIGEPRQRWVRN